MSELENENNNEMDLETSSPTEFYFCVSTLKFILMSIGTLGFYQLYWHYKNWSYLKISKSLDIMPFGRAIFAHLWAFSLFNYIYKSASENNIKTKIPPVLLGII